MKDYAIIYNPTAAAGKSKKDFEIMEQTLKDKGVSYKLFQTQRFGHAIELAQQCAKDGFRVIGAGGDGTCNEILNGVIYSNTDALVGFVPMGSGNDIPGAIGVKPDVKRACQVIAEENIQKHDVGMATTQSLEKPRYFLGIGSQGFDAKVTKVTNAEEKNLTGTWDYVKNVIKLVFSFKKRKVRVVMDDETFEGPCNLVAVGNGPSYGGGMYMCPYAKTNDQTFHISIIQMGTFQLLYNFNKMYSRTLQPHPGALEFTSKNV